VSFKNNTIYHYADTITF